MSRNSLIALRVALVGVIASCLAYGCINAHETAKLWQSYIPPSPNPSDVLNNQILFSASTLLASSFINPKKLTETAIDAVSSFMSYVKGNSRTSPN